MTKKILALAIALCLIAGMAAGCTVDEGRDKDDTVDTSPSAEESTDTSATESTDPVETDPVDPIEIIGEIISGKRPYPTADELSLIAEGMSAEQFPEKDCAVVYNDSAAWVFDSLLSTVTPVVDLEKMITCADPAGLAGQYFENVTIEYEFREIDYAVVIEYTVTSLDDAQCTFNVDSLYRTLSVTNLGLSRGDHSDYHFNSIAYPGSSDSLTVTSLDDIDKLYPHINPTREFPELFTALIQNDVSAMEKSLGAKDGSLSVWEGTVISDYVIERKMPIQSNGWYSMEFTIEHSTVERYPAGRYRIIEEMIMELEPLDGENAVYVLPEDADQEAVDFAYTWGSYHGGKMPKERQDPADPGFAHVMLDYLLYVCRVKGGNDTAFTGNDYREYAEKYLGFTGFSNEYTAYGDSPIGHGGHGFNISLSEVTGYRSENGVHYVSVSIFADPLKSVIAQTHTYAMVEVEEGIYALVGTEFDYESELGGFGWAV